MSRAFVKETDSDRLDELPEKLISEHRNLVTPEGLAQIEDGVEAAQAALAAAQSADDRDGVARAARDLRYWTKRQASAELQPAPAPDGTVHFGSRVTLLRTDGRKLTYRIVGEDQADPATGTISYVAPLAQALIGKSVGDEATVGSGSAEIVAIA